MNKLSLLLFITVIELSCNTGKTPEPYGPLPTARQLNWHTLETYAFVHFNMNT